MKQAGQIVLFRFPQTDMAAGKLRPALLLGRVPGPYEDWLVCMISSQLRQYNDGFDEIVREDDVDFGASGLKVPSVIRVGRLRIGSVRVVDLPVTRVPDVPGNQEPAPQQYRCGLRRPA